MEGSGRVIFGQDGPDQNSFNKILCCHQNVEAMAAVLDASFKNLSDNSYNLVPQNQQFIQAYISHTMLHRRSLTVRANMISLKFLFPTILFFRALTESLGLNKNKEMFSDGPFDLTSVLG